MYQMVLEHARQAKMSDSVDDFEIVLRFSSPSQ